MKAKFLAIRVSTYPRFPLTHAKNGENTGNSRCQVLWALAWGERMEAVAASPPWVANVWQVCVLSSKPWIILWFGVICRKTDGMWMFCSLETLLGMSERRWLQRQVKRTTYFPVFGRRGVDAGRRHASETLPCSDPELVIYNTTEVYRTLSLSVTEENIKWYVGSTVV